MLKRELLKTNITESTNHQIIEGDVLEHNITGTKYLVVYERFYCCFALFMLEFIEDEDYDLSESFYNCYSLNFNKALDYTFQYNILENPIGILTNFNPDQHA